MPEFVMSQMHIEAARNSTDDFNLFHDKNRWQLIKDNPFNGPIALGFQLGCFIEDQVRHSAKGYDHQQVSYKRDRETLPRLNFSQYELSFAGCVRPRDELSLVVREGKYTQRNDRQVFSNRIALKANGKTVMLGYKRQSNSHSLEGVLPIPDLKTVLDSDDRSFVSENSYFVKRKYMIVGNAKNFLTSAFAEQSEYIDEFIDKVSFPEMYPLSLISSALLERAQAVGQDLIAAPMIYISQKLSIDQDVLKSLKSNHAITILVGPASKDENQENGNITHVCSCITDAQQVLFHGEIQLAPLASIKAS